jgi:tetrahydromethanopterin S-methyltransferase subunit B
VPFGEGAILHKITTNIGDFLADQAEQYAFIHMSHVIEHISKYSLLWVVDGLFFALQHNGTLFLRTPNMEGPAANSAYYVTLAHEYGFAGSNLESLLAICGFDDVVFHSPPPPSSLKQKIGGILRSWFHLREPDSTPFVRSECRQSI